MEMRNGIKDNRQLNRGCERILPHCLDPVNFSREQDHDFHLACSKEGFSEPLGPITSWSYTRVPFTILQYSQDVSGSFGQGEDDVNIQVPREEGWTYRGITNQHMLMNRIIIIDATVPAIPQHSK